MNQNAASLVDSSVVVDCRYSLIEKLLIANLIATLIAVILLVLIMIDRVMDTFIST